MRADKFLAQHGYYESRARARAALDAGLVIADGVVVAKPSLPLDETMIIEAGQVHPWVSRSGMKLAHAIEAFGVETKDRICLDVGASTGGFSDVLLDGGAAFITAVDVGTGQLHKKLHNVERLVSMEKMDARNLTAEHFDVMPDLIVCDVSFISCMKVLKVPLSLVGAGAELITLVKPQFEVGLDGISRNGIVRDPVLAARCVRHIRAWLEEQGWQVLGQDRSPIKGGDGNHEFLLYARKQSDSGKSDGPTLAANKSTANMTS